MERQQERKKWGLLSGRADMPDPLFSQVDVAVEGKEPQWKRGEVKRKNEGMDRPYRGTWPFYPNSDDDAEVLHVTDTKGHTE